MLRPFRSLGRLRQITTVVARHGLGHFLEGRRARSGHRTSVKRAPPSDNGPRLAVRFCALLEELGPTFVKFGQVLSTRPDLLPHGFADVLATLQDHVPPMPADEAQRVVADGLGRDPAEIFAEFDPVPVASASVAQVHHAITRSGREVAVKVQRAGIRNRILDDLDLLHYLAQLLDAMVEEGGLVTPAAILEEFESAFLAELDFEREARMMERFRANIEGKDRAYVVPEVFRDLSCEAVLTMEYVRGDNLWELPEGRDRKAIASNVVQTAFDQIFVDGLFHADPHPGNAFVLEDDRLVLLDFGCVGQISYAMRETLVVLVLAMANRDADTVTRLLYRVGIPDRRVSLHRLRDECASLFDRYLRDQTTLANIEASQLLRELFELAARYRVRIPSEYALIARASVVVEGTIRHLDPDLGVLKTAGPYIKRLVEEQFTVPQLGDTALKGLLRARGFVQELPLTASQILMDLESGKLQIQVENPKLEAIAQNINALGVTVFMGFLAGGLVAAGAFFLLKDFPTNVGGLPVLPMAALGFAAMLFGGVLGRYFLLPRVRKLSIGRWLNSHQRRR